MKFKFILFSPWFLKSPVEDIGSVPVRGFGQVSGFRSNSHTSSSQGIQGFVGLYVCMYVCIYIYTSVCMCIYIYIYTYTYILT